jgi:hypothetical protein
VQGVLRVFGRFRQVRQAIAFQACLAGIVDHVRIVGVDCSGTLDLGNGHDLAVELDLRLRGLRVAALALPASPRLVGAGGGASIAARSSKLAIRNTAFLLMIARYSGPAGPAWTRHSLNAGVGTTIFSFSFDRQSIRYSIRSRAFGVDDFTLSSRMNRSIEASNTTI